MSGDYPDLKNDDYFRLTDFGKENSRPLSYDEIIDMNRQNKNLSISKFSIKKNVAQQILDYIENNALNTRGKVRHISDDEATFTNYTVRFCIHVIHGKRGGWYIVENDGRMPIIADEFIEYGPLKKNGSGRRKNGYRRKMSYSEKNQVEYLESKTPSIEQIYRWIVKRNPTDVLKLNFHTSSGLITF